MKRMSIFLPIGVLATMLAVHALPQYIIVRG